MQDSVADAMRFEKMRVYSQPAIERRTKPGMYSRRIPTLHPGPISSPIYTFLIHLSTSLPTSSQRNRRNRIQNPRNLIRRHLAILHTPHLTTFAQSLQAKRKLPALALIDEEDVFLTICVADRSAEDV